MRYLLACALIAITVPLAAATQHLSGVSDEETEIRPGEIREFHQGKGDVLFVRDRTGHWYRVALNEGCMRNIAELDSVVFDVGMADYRIDRFTKVTLFDGLPRSCRIDSIRRSEAPPQVDSKSRVTLD